MPDEPCEKAEPSIFHEMDSVECSVLVCPNRFTVCWNGLCWKYHWEFEGATFFSSHYQLRFSSRKVQMMPFALLDHVSNSIAVWLFNIGDTSAFPGISCLKPYHMLEQSILWTVTLSCRSLRHLVLHWCSLIGMMHGVVMHVRAS